MKLRILTLIVFVFGLFPSPHGLAPTSVQANTTDWSYISTDVDGDGLPNDVETGGWCNRAGCFITDPFDADSDNDGLTDGEEKLFDSNPNNSSSPGIYVVYDDSFKTQEYYPWQPYAHKMIARSDDFIPPRPDEIDVQTNHGTDLDAIVIRRGTTFSIGGPLHETLQIEKSKSSLTDLDTSRDPHTGIWSITVPANGTVGKYTLSMGNLSLDLFVIFELPTPSGELTQLGIEKFLYDDNPDRKHDKTSLLMASQSYFYSNNVINPQMPWWNGDYPPYQIPSGEFMVEGGSYAFDNQQYNRYLFEEYVMDAINGQNNQKEAADKLADKTDEKTVFRNPRVFYNAKNVLDAINSSNQRNQCSGVAGVLTSFNRAAGIPSRVLLTDWHTATFDHANEVWVNGEWRVYRGYSKFEMKSYPDDTPTGCSSSTWPACGANKYQTRYNWGKNNYRPWHSGGTGNGNVVILANETWETVSTRAYRWPSWLADGNKRGVSMVRRNWFETVHDEYWQYWGWTEEPTVTSYNINAWPPAPPEEEVQLSPLAASSSQGETDSSPFDYESPEAQLGNVVAEYGVDLNGNGYYDQLVLEVEVTVAEAGNYWLRGQLSPDGNTPDSLAGTGGVIADTPLDLYLEAGTHTVQLTFDGVEIALQQVDGPYRLSSLWLLGDVEDPGPTEFSNDSLAYRWGAYTTSSYQATDFESYGALLSNSYDHYELDSDGNGVPDALVVTTGIEIFEPNEYQVVGNLYGGDDEFISQAIWTGSGPDVTLQFNDVSGTLGPYTLRDLELRKPALNPLDLETTAIHYLHDAYTIDIIPELVTATAASFELYGGPDAIMAFGVGITPTTSFNTSLQNGDLKLDAQVDVSLSGSYKLEAWLADQNGNLITWAQGNAVTKQPGLQQNLSVTFDGANILARGIPGPYKIVGLKVLNGNVPYSVIDEVGELPQQTQAYQLSSFAASPNSTIVFEDYAEGGSGKWSPAAPWAIENDIHQYLTVSKAWSADNAEATLTIASPLNLAATGYDLIELKFLTSYDFGSGEAGYVEVSTNGSTWTPLATYTDSASWSQAPQLIDLTAYAGQAALQVRFRLAAPGGAWKIDDVVIIAKGEDTDGDGISDEEEGTDDPDGDGIPNYLDTDSDGDGIPDKTEGTGDPDGDGIPNYLDLDSDGDGIPDKTEGTGDPDGDGIPNYLDLDSDGDSMPDKDEWTNSGLLPYCGNQGGIDTDEDGRPNCRDNDVDGDGIPNYLDTDSDGDGKPDSVEIGSPTNPTDTDGDSIPDYLDSEDEKQNFGIILQSIYLPIVTK